MNLKVMCLNVHYKQTLPLMIHINGKVKVKLSLCFNWSPCHEGILEEWRYSSTHSL